MAKSDKAWDMLVWGEEVGGGQLTGASAEDVSGGHDGPMVRRYAPLLRVCIDASSPGHQHDHGPEV